MAKVAIIIDGWFMRKRIYKLGSFHYDGPSIRCYCMNHVRNGKDDLYRIFYYDTLPLEKKGQNPITRKNIDFSKTDVAKKQYELFESIKKTPNFALRLGKTVWQNNNWMLTSEKTKELYNKKISIDDLVESDICPVIKQKEVDMKMGLDIALISTKKLAEVLVIITGDSDIVPALKFARREGIIVGLDPLWNPIKPNLVEHVDFVKTHVTNPRSPC